MSSQRQMVSRVRGLDKLLSSDASITDRVILSELKSNAIFLIKQQIDKRRLWETSTVFTNIPCIEMIQVPLSECCDYTSECTIARSKYQLPKISEGIFGLLIHGVFSVDNGRELTYTTISRFINLLKLNLPQSNIFYWFYNHYLYVSSNYVEVINIWAYFEEDISDNLLYPACKCPNQNKKNPCLNPLDLEFKCPGYLEKPAIDLTLKVLLETYFRLNDDKTSDNKDDQVSKQ